EVGAELGEGPVDRGLPQLRLAAEVVAQQAECHPGLLRDVASGGAVEPVVGERHERSLEDQLAGVGGLDGGGGSRHRLVPSNSAVVPLNSSGKQDRGGAPWKAPSTTSRSPASVPPGRRSPACSGVGAGGSWSSSAIPRCTACRAPSTSTTR